MISQEARDLFAANVKAIEQRIAELEAEGGN